MGLAQNKKRKMFQKELTDKFGKKMMKQIFAESDFRYKELMAEYKDKESDELIHVEIIVGQVALYEAMQKHMPKEDAYGIFRRVTHGVCTWVAKIGSFVTAFPGGSRFVLKLMRKLELELFDEKQGFKKQIVVDEKDEFRFYVLRCPYFDYFSKYGCPELCQLACESDNWSYGSIKRFKMIVNGTLGLGSDKCDYTYRSDKFKEEVK